MIRKRLSVTGVVQGVGFRPFVWRRASRHGLAGWVENDTAGVTVEVQGTADRVAAFLEGFAAAAPPLAVVRDLRIDEVPVEPGAEPPLLILPSAAEPGPTTSVPPDTATCGDCLAEIRDPANRRHAYPFTNCTNCGPRFTIIRDLPYDRPRTTMREFPLCPRCAAEYTDPADRRFHAQPNACPECGPTVWLTGVEGHAPATGRAAATVDGAAAVERARALLREGAILAVKGIGGFHLVCDATDDAAVSRLRERKHRVGKPLAVMVADLAAARAVAQVDEQERRLLEGRDRPIVLLRKRESPARISPQVSPGNDFLGVMLPYSPLHELLCAGMPPLVMTSGNLAEEPIVHDNAAAARVLRPLADGFLMHDRPIHGACDDSVVRCAAGTVMPIRRSRGQTPLPIVVPAAGPAVLAVGGELKAALCLVHDGRAVMSQHLGDMGNLETLDALARAADHLVRLFRVEPEVVAADLHPGYLSAGWARRFAAERGIPLVQVQHHEAHVAAVLAEHGRPFDAAIGVCFDGTGYGRDGTIQGGEFYTAARGSLDRAAWLDPFPLPGGDASVRHPWRTALAVLHAAGIAWDDRLAPTQAGSAGSRGVLARQLGRDLHCVPTSSMGRLFDAVAALVGAKQSISYEAEAAMNLEAAAAAVNDAGDAAYRFDLLDGTPPRIGWRGVVGAVVADVLAGVPPAAVAARFHRAVAEMVATVCRRLRSAGGGDTVGLTGGVFQNALLVRLTIDALHRADFEVLCHRRVPPNDGGLALGQAVLARARFPGTRP